ncbi:MAG TPA: hypothetical protein VJX67_23785, partial [Blastocatellia bacterium]|nr:hypothetical protein [Blastocatellia bacterium]
WQKMGLDDSEHIAAIVVDPRDGNTVYVAATGHLWNSNSERGVFKTTDGGKTWRKVLFVNDDTGCSSLAIDPQQPNIVYAGMWQFRRKPYAFSSGGPGSGLYKSTDAGATWKKLTEGLPTGELGRIGVAVSPSRSSRLYAIVESKHTALLRSDDQGETWTQGNAGQTVVDRPFYFGTLFTDPKDFDRVYKPGTGLVVSDDAGKTFSGLGGSVHSDFHAMWINPSNPEELFIGCDGGLYTTVDRGATWRFVSNLPISQFYHVSSDMDRPYNVYGGLQDNSSWYGPSTTPDTIRNRDWRGVYGGDGFWVFPDPTDTDYVYAEYQGGNLARINRKTLENRNIKPLPNADEKLRFNWNTPLHISPTKKGTIYIGAQFLFRSRDHGDSWERISPDLTTNDPALQKQEESGGLTVDNSDAETHTTIFTISESPRNSDVIWVGTDDGNVQVTRNGGKSWNNVAGNVTGLPSHTWVSTIEASHFDEGTAYATFDGHAGGDMKPYVYKTTDYGKTWQSLATPDIRGYAHVVREDPVDRDLLFTGTEFGLFISIDGGKQWAQFKGGNFPGVAVRDVSVQSRESDLLIATHGRGIWILDDITPLRNLTPEILASEASFVASRPAVLLIAGGAFEPTGDGEFLGPSSSQNALITYYQRKRHIFGDLKIEIYDPDGKLVSTLDGNKRRGLNRVEWPMRMKPPKLPPAADLVASAIFGPRILPGTYTVKMSKGKGTYETKIKVVPDPRASYGIEDRKVQHEAVMKLYDMLGELTYTVDTLVDARNQARDRAAKLPEGDPLRKKASDLADSLEQIRSKLVATREGGGGITGEEKIREKMGDLYGSINSYDGRPTASQLERTAAVAKEFEEAKTQFEQAVARDVAALNAELEKKPLPPVKVMNRADWEKSQK